jgi:hypothetical protein
MDVETVAISNGNVVTLPKVVLTTGVSSVLVSALAHNADEEADNYSTNSTPSGNLSRKGSAMGAENVQGLSTANTEDSVSMSTDPFEAHGFEDESASVASADNPSTKNVRYMLLRHDFWDEHGSQHERENGSEVACGTIRIGKEFQADIPEVGSDCTYEEGLEEDLLWSCSSETEKYTNDFLKGMHMCQMQSLQPGDIMLSRVGANDTNKYRCVINYSQIPPMEMKEMVFFPLVVSEGRHVR